MNVRTGAAADCASIGAVHVAAWRETYRGLLPDEVLQGLSVSERAAQWRRFVERAAPMSVLLVAEHDAGWIGGFAAGGARRGTELPYDGEVYAIYLLQEFQGCGLGRRLLGTLAAGLRDRGAGSLCTWVLRENAPASRFYEHMGGEKVAERVDCEAGVDVVEVGYAWTDLDDPRLAPRAP